MHETGQHGFVRTDPSQLAGQYARSGSRTQRMVPEHFGKFAEDRCFLGTHELVHGDCQRRGAHHLNTEPLDRRLQIPWRRTVRTVQCRTSQLHQSGGDHGLQADDRRNARNRQVRVLKFLAQAEGGIEIGRKNNRPGQFSGDIFQHLETLRVKHGAMFIDVGVCRVRRMIESTHEMCKKFLGHPKPGLRDARNDSTTR